VVNPDAEGDGWPVDRVREDVGRGLSREQKQISSKYFYDRRGSELFEEITRLPEYYPTRAERRLLREHIPGWVRDHGTCTLVELGAGAADKTRTILDAMTAVSARVTYVPIDISGEFLERVAAGLRSDYPDLDVRPLVADISQGFHVPDDVPHPILYAFLGSTLGNFPRAEGEALLERVRQEMRPADRFLLGVDLKKDRAVLEAAYNDGAGVTAAFNLNVLTVLNRVLGADFDTGAFRHRAFYAEDDDRIEMHLVAERDTAVEIPGVGRFTFDAGESIRTEVSCKYDRVMIDAAFERTGLQVTRWFAAPEGFALVLAEGR
jgi:L-histidine N-alpha-methyltransferase